MTGEREKNGDPKTRPICDGSQSLNCRLSDIICKILTPLLREKRGEEGDEVESTEELLSVVERLNKKLEKETKPADIIQGSKNSLFYYDIVKTQP